MADFWQSPGNGTIINLEHVVGADRLATAPAEALVIRVVTACHGVSFTLSDDAAQSFLGAVALRMKRLGNG